MFFWKSDDWTRSYSELWSDIPEWCTNVIVRDLFDQDLSEIKLSTGKRLQEILKKYVR